MTFTSGLCCMVCIHCVPQAAFECNHCSYHRSAARSSPCFPEIGPWLVEFARRSDEIDPTFVFVQTNPALFRPYLQHEWPSSAQHRPICSMLAEPGPLLAGFGLSLVNVGRFLADGVGRLLANVGRIWPNTDPVLARFVRSRAKVG